MFDFSAPEIELVVEDGEQEEEPDFEDSKIVLDSCMYILILHC